MTALHLGGFLVSILLVFASALPQAVPEPPLTMQQVESLFNYEKDRPAFKDSTRNEVDRRGVDFALTADIERKWRILGMDHNLIDMIRNRVKITTLTVQCEPVECQVTVNNEVAGTTDGSFLTKSPVNPGLLTINVTASNFEAQTVAVRISPGEHLRVPKFTMEGLKGGLAITCEPVSVSVCGITIKGPNGFARKAETAERLLTVRGLPLGRYEVEASAAPAFLPKTETVWISTPDVRTLPMKLEEDPWGSKTDLQVFDAVVGSLGGKPVLTVGVSSRNTARMRVAGDPASIGMWNGVQAVEYQARDRMRWELAIAGTKWQVLFDGTKVVSKGDKKYSGTEFAQELEHSIRLFSTMKLPSILSLIRAKFDIKKGPEQVMIAESADERFTFQLNADYLPTKVLHERLTAPRSREEMEFAQYKSIGQDLMLPHVVILRYPDRPKHEHIFEYDKIDITAQIREALFKP